MKWWEEERKISSKFCSVLLEGRYKKNSKYLLKNTAFQVDGRNERVGVRGGGSVTKKI